jgi:GNAT superfamily N-acetyltransferase
VSQIEVRAIDKQDERQVRDWWEATHAGATAGRPYDTYTTWELARQSATTLNPDWELVLFVAYDEGRAVGAGVTNMPLADNLDHAYLEVYIPPAERRRGVGTAVLRAAEDAATSRGRTVLVAESFAPVGGTSPGEPFAAKHGYLLGNREGFKVLDLRDHPDWEPLDELVAARVEDYRVMAWTDRVPDELLEDVCAALNRFVGMTPTGDLEMGELNYTPERIRRTEARARELGTTRLAAAGLAPDGTLAGYHDLWVDAARTSQAYVGLTMVLPEHRGRSLGLAMKLATHRSLLARFPECEIVRTGNADVNEHMNAVNEQLGYRLVEQILEVQKRVAG